MRTDSAIAARSMSDIGSTPETSTRRNDTSRRTRARSTDPALLALAAGPSSRAPIAAGEGRASRAPVEQLQRFSASGEIKEAATHATLGELMHREWPTATTTAYMQRLNGATAKVAPPSQSTDGTPAFAASTAKPRSVRALPSGRKIDGMNNVLMSAYDLDDDQLSSVTEALGLGPAHPDEYVRNMQTVALGRILRDSVYQGPPAPPAASIQRLQLGRGLPPERVQKLVAAAEAAGCFMSEREQKGADGKRRHLLQLHFKASVDYGQEPLAAQPDSVNYKAVKALAELMAEVTAPAHRTDGQHFSIESVAASVEQGGSYDVFARHFADHAQARPAYRYLSAEVVNEANIRNGWLLTALTPEQKDKFVRAANVSHLQFEERRSTAADGTRYVKLRIFFGGTENWRDVKQALVSGTGGVGKVFGAVRDAAELMALKIDQAQREGYSVEFEHIAGASMGGASAQLFTAALQSRVELRKQPPLVVLDPQLPNAAQLRHAVKGGTREYDYAKPRGVAVTLDYPANPSKGLMGRMKGLGFKSPGLVRLKLALSDYDGTTRSPDGEIERSAPQTSGPPGMGYHADPELYLAAINRFTRRVQLR